MTNPTGLQLTLSLTRLVVEGETTWDGQITDGLPEPIYGFGATADEVKNDIVAVLKERGISGSLSVTYPQRGSDEPLATEKQINYAMYLYRQKIAPDAPDAELQVIRDSYATLTRQALSVIIDKNISLPKMVKPAPAPKSVAGQKVAAVEEGIWTVGEDIYKVQIAVNGSGFKYAKKLNKGGGFAKAPGGSMKLISEQGVKLTEEKAKAYGDLYGSCCCCGRTLTDENSIARGIGPICASKYF